MKLKLKDRELSTINILEINQIILKHAFHFTIHWESITPKLSYKIWFPRRVDVYVYSEMNAVFQILQGNVVS